MYEMVRKSPVSSLRAGDLPAAGAWDGAPALEHSVAGESEVSFFVEYTQGHATGACEVLFEGSPMSSGDDWFPLVEALDETAATLSGQSLPVPVRTVSLLLTGTQKAPVHTVRLGGVERVRVRARETGRTAAPGALVVRARSSTGAA